MWTKTVSLHRILYEQYGRSGYVQIVFVEASQGFLVAHPRHGQNEWEENKDIGRLLAERGEAVVLLPNQVDRPSPDALRGGDEWEFKTVKSQEVSRAIQHALRRGKKQSPHILCLVLNTSAKNYELTLGIYRAVRFDLAAQIRRVAILFPNGRLIEMSREEIRNTTFVFKFDQP